ncbi:MAG: diguanylate cyclase, partial [Spirochaetia bacterium]|nr:diguanylate cyclase [Spirochaetia bacterium]
FICHIDFKNFSEFNRVHGWKKGNEILISFGKYLSEKLKKENIFRVHGDDILIFSDQEPRAIERIVLEHENIQENTMNINFSSISSDSVSTGSFEELMKIFMEQS